MLQACHEIDFANQIILDERIGSGAFGSVYRGASTGSVGPSPELPVGMKPLLQHALCL